nr:hypothetical protein [Candidatus Gracilibacteria bacterium]
MSLLSLTNTDYFILVLSLLSGLFFIFLGLEKLHRFYFGIIIGFILFITMNLHIKLLILPNVVLKDIIIPDSGFLLENKKFILSFLTSFIPIFGIILLLTDFISFKVYDNKIASFIFGLLFPFFFLSILSYIHLNSAIDISFIKDFFVFSDSSFIISYFDERAYLALYLLFFLIFFRLIFWFIVSFIIYISKQFYSSYKTDSNDSHSEHTEVHEEHHH